MAKELDLLELATELSKKEVGKFPWEFGKPDRYRKREFDEIENLFNDIFKAPLPVPIKSALALRLNQAVDSKIARDAGHDDKIPKHYVSENTVSITETGKKVQDRWTKRIVNLPVLPREVIEKISSEFEFIIVQRETLTDPYEEGFREEVDIEPWEKLGKKSYPYLWVLGPIEMYSVHRHINTKKPRPVYGYGTQSGMAAFMISSFVSTFLDVYKKLEDLSQRVEEMNIQIEEIRNKLKYLEEQVRAISRAVDRTEAKVRTLQLEVGALEERVSRLEFICLRDPLVIATSEERFEKSDEIMIIDSFLTGRSKSKPQRCVVVEFDHECGVLDECYNYFGGEEFSKARRGFKESLRVLYDKILNG